MSHAVPSRFPSPFRSLVALTLALAIGASIAPASATSRRGRQRDRDKEPAAADRGIRRYDPALFGPEMPLDQIARRAGLAMDGDRLRDARVLVLKRERRLEVWSGDVMLKAYRIQLGARPVGDKVKMRDSRTPEGDYFVCGHRPSRYHRALLLSFPNAKDAARGLDDGRIVETQAERIRADIAAGHCPPQDTKLGGWLMIHGQDPKLTNWIAGAQRRGRMSLAHGQQVGDGNPAGLDEVWDWTAGCIALLNPDVRELYDGLPDGTRVEIRPAGTPTKPLPVGKIAELVGAGAARPRVVDAPIAPASVSPEPRVRPVGIH